MHPLARVVQGLPVSWEPIPHPIVFAAAWSPCSRFIAVARSDSIMIEVLDSVTLERLNTFEPPYTT